MLGKRPDDRWLRLQKTIVFCYLCILQDILVALNGRESRGQISPGSGHGASAHATGGARGCSVIVVSYRTGPILIHCLRSVLVQDGLHQLILVDNGNTTKLMRGASLALNSRNCILSGHGNGVQPWCAACQRAISAFVEPRLRDAANNPAPHHVDLGRPTRCLGGQHSRRQYRGAATRRSP